MGALSSESSAASSADNAPDLQGRGARGPGGRHGCRQGPCHHRHRPAWHAARKHVACLRTIRSQIENMITGVTYGFAYKMRLVYAHFPINVIIADDKKSVEIRNFLGEKRVRHVQLLDGVTISESKSQ